MPTVQGFGSWKSGSPPNDSSMLTANRRKRAEYLDYLNAQSTLANGPVAITAYGPAASWTGPVPFGSTALQQIYVNGPPVRKVLNLQTIFHNNVTKYDKFCGVCTAFSNRLQ